MGVIWGMFRYIGAAGAFKLCKCLGQNNLMQVPLVQTYFVYNNSVPMGLLSSPENDLMLTDDLLS